MLALVAHLSVPTPAAASAMCSTVCPGGATLKCCTSGTCSTVNGVKVTCNGTVMNCGPADTYHACVTDCGDWVSQCFDTCEDNCGHCSTGYQLCVQRCGTPPVTNIGC
jgi:hypothetical protein